MAWGGARCALAAKITTSSPPASVCSMGRRPVLHEAKRAWVARHGSQTRSPQRYEAASRRPGALLVGKCLSQRRGAKRVARWPRRQPRQVRKPARDAWAVDRLSTGRSVRGSRGTEVKHGRHDVPKPQAADLARCWCGRALANGARWSAERVGRVDNHAKSASARVLRGRAASSPRGEARAGRAPRESNAVVTTFRSCSRRPGTVSVKKSLGQQRRSERVTRWP